MLKISLKTLFFLLLSLQVFSQMFKIDSISRFEKKSLNFEEANIVTSYYQQDGNHSAITGGIGTEKLTDVANIIDFKLSYKNGLGKKYIFGGEMGIDYYTSASSDKIDTKVSSASSSDVRYYPSINYRVENEKTGFSYGSNLAYSQEYDYRSYGGGLQFSQLSKNQNTELSGRLNVFFDAYDQIVPNEFRSGLIEKRREKGNIGIAPRNTFDLSLTLSQILSKRFQIALTVDASYQKGLLSTPFHRVYMNEGSLFREHLPDQKFKVPVSIRANYFLSEKMIIRSFYRYYQDNWGMNAHTMQFELPYKISSFYSVSPFYRFHRQTAIDHFAPYGENRSDAQFYTSDYDLSGLDSHFYGIGVRHTPFKTVMNLFSISQLELRAALYNRSDGLDSGIVSFHVQFKGF
jgi:hypothetical protein